MPSNRGETKPWERQEKESTAAFQAFSIYLGMGADRSYSRVVQELGKSSALIARWGSAWGWQERIRAYDNHLSEEESKAVRKEIKERYARYGRISDKLTAKALEALGSIDAERMSSQDLLAYMRMAVMLADKHKEHLMPQERDEEGEDLLEGLLRAFESERD